MNGEKGAGIITNCWSINNNITATGGSIGSSGYAGGIVGYPLHGATISKCYNNSNVSAYFAGGIVGGSIDGNVTIKQCYNLGSIEATKCARAE